MVSAWTDLLAQGEDSVATSKWLIEHLLRAEHTDRAMRSVSHQMTAAKFPVHRDLAGFDFDSSKVDQALVRQLATLTFTDTAQNAWRTWHREDPPGHRHCGVGHRVER